MITKHLVVLCCVWAITEAAIGSGDNSYLPPKQGYQYDKPSVGFPGQGFGGGRPSSPSPFQNTQPTYRPQKQQTFPTRPPSYQPPKPLYGAPSRPASSQYQTPQSYPSSRPAGFGGAPSRPVPTQQQQQYLPPPPAPSRPSSAPSFRPPPAVARPAAPTQSYLPPPGTGFGAGPTGPAPRPQPAPGFRPTQAPHHGDASGHYPDSQSHGGGAHEPGMPFQFEYNVNDVENDFGHKSVSDGDVTKGEYRVQLPDGRMQIVQYTADWANGYNAQVRYEAGTPKAPLPGRQPITGGGGTGFGGGAPTGAAGGGYPASQRPGFSSKPGGRPPFANDFNANAGYPSGKPGGGSGQQYSPGGGYKY